MDTVTLSGTVTPFKGNGRELGYPTANITSETDLQDGVYFGHATLGQFTDQPSLIFIGIPTTMGDTDRRVEVHMLDVPDEDYYGLTVSVAIEYYHRPNQTYDSVAELLTVIQSDETAGRAWLSKHPVTQSDVSEGA